MKSPRPLLLAFVVLASCRTAPPPSAEGKAAPPVRRVILVSLDGAAAPTLQRLWRQGAFTEGGFRQFFEEGQVADQMLPVTPSLTAVNHISLATGYAPDATGIVSNRYHPADAPKFLDAVSGFDAPIATETLWEAAQRQGKRVAVVTWPGADGKGEGNRRKGTWGLTYVGNAKQDSEIVTLARSDWTPADRNDPRLQGLRSFAPILRAALPSRGIDVAALDRKDDRKTAYDTLVPLVPSAAHTPVAPGAWGSFPCVGAWAEGGTTCLLKLLELAPDLATAKIYLNGIFANEAYPEAFGREFNESGLLWPGPPDDTLLSASWDGKPGIDTATWVEQAERFTGFFGAALRLAAARDDWDLLMGYFPTIDEAGHQLLLTEASQPNFTPQRRAEFAQARRRVWQAVDRELAALLRVVDLRDTRIVIVSDHGMLPIHTLADPDVLLQEKGFLVADEKGKIQDEGTKVWIASAGGIAHLYVRPDAPDRERLIEEMRTLFTDWTVEGGKPIERIVRRAEAKELGLDHPNSGDLILFSAPGFGFSGAGLREHHASKPTPAYGMHGGLLGDPELNSIYLALGAGLRKGNAGTVQNTEVAKRVAEWLRIEAPRASVP
jgi:hypothetical protein